MSKKIYQPINSGVTEAISKVLADTEKGLTGAELDKFIPQAKLKDVDPTNTKWKRLYNSFADYQNRQQNSNNILTFITQSMAPSRFVGKLEHFEERRIELNKCLSFEGMEFTEEGRLRRVSKSSTITEAEQRANQLKEKLNRRNVHSRIFEYCNAELLQENYFHTVFEATKSVAEEIRRRTGLTEDGAELIEKAFSIRNPLIQINDLSTETKQSEHKGFANLIKGVFGMFRNTTAHAPRLVWEINEEDALDVLSTISLIHRKLE